MLKENIGEYGVFILLFLTFTLFAGYVFAVISPRQIKKYV